MTATVILSDKQHSKFSKIFRVYPGKVLVINSFNFSGPVTDEFGEVTRQGDCAILHKIEITSDLIPQIDGCARCANGVLEGLSTHVVSSEPIIQCGDNWSHNCENNLSVLAVPGVYIFELCDERSIGSVSIAIEELSVEEAALIPANLFNGA